MFQLNDLKLINFLIKVDINNSGNIDNLKINNFVSSKNLEKDDEELKVGTLYYMAPEMLFKDSKNN